MVLKKKGATQRPRRVVRRAVRNVRAKKLTRNSPRPRQVGAAVPKNRIIILGAGFSRPAGLPLATDLWKEIREAAARFPADHRAHKFNKDLQAYIEFRKDADGCTLSPETVDFEDFMRFLDVEHYLALRGGDTWSSDGNEGTVVTKYLIGKILARHVNALKTVPDLYIQFAQRLEPRDIVFTFNYDTLLERSLDAIRKPYRLFTYRYESVDELSGTLNTDDSEVVILKVHGSIDWFDRTNFERQIAYNQRLGAPPPKDVIFSSAHALGLEPIVDGPRSSDDPLRNVYRARNLEALYEKKLLFLATPRILPPSAAKLLYASQSNDFWRGVGQAGYYNFGLAIVGFSLPQQDEYARQIIYGLVTQYQRFRQAEKDFGMTKSPVTIVDFFHDAASEARFRERYRFVDWSNARLIGKGFNNASLDKIFC